MTASIGRVSRSRVGKAFCFQTLRMLACLFLLSCLTIDSNPADNNPSLKFLVSGKVVDEITLDVLKSKLKSYRIELNDTEYKKAKRYEGFKIGDMLRLAYGDKLDSPDYTDIAFTALDGYESIAALSKMKGAGGYIVFADLDSEVWEPVGRTRANPGPFYLVWTGMEQTPRNEYPWPWQIASINIMRFQDQYPLVYPSGAKIDSPVYKGYE
ncbi:MAG: hypothetical protein ACHQ6U_13160, partial [Thermodesulfobacteriota bacterium]